MAQTKSQVILAESSLTSAQSACSDSNEELYYFSLALFRSCWTLTGVDLAAIPSVKMTLQ